MACLSKHTHGFGERAAWWFRAVWPMAATCCLAWPLAVSGAPSVLQTQPASWTFRVLLDGQPIGEHRFTTTPSADGAAYTLVGEASFAVRLLGVTLYRYRHRSLEQWRGDCLVSLASDTDDNGRLTRVSAETNGDVFEVSAPATLALRGCVMSFAYWNPALRLQTRLLNAQTGRVESVRVEAIADGAHPIGTPPADAIGWRIDGIAQPIDVWYSRQGRWLGLDTRVDGRRILSYRAP